MIPMSTYAALIAGLEAIANDIKEQYTTGLRDDGEPLTFNEKTKLLTLYMQAIDRVQAYEKQKPAEQKHEQLSLIPVQAMFPEAKK